MLIFYLIQMFSLHEKGLHISLFSCESRTSNSNKSIVIIIHNYHHDHYYFHHHRHPGQFTKETGPISVQEQGFRSFISWDFAQCQ